MEEHSQRHLAFTSYETALCLIPPRTLWESVDRLRGLYDKAFGVWPPHLNLVYPFVEPTALNTAASILGQVSLRQCNPRVNLEAADTFLHKNHNTIFLRPANSQDEYVFSQIRDDICRALGQSSKTEYRPHMTIGQSENPIRAPHHFLLEKARLLAPIAWDQAQVAILIRDTALNCGEGSRSMRLWATLEISSPFLKRYETPEVFYTMPSITTYSENGSMAPCTVAQKSFCCSGPSRTWKEVSEPVNVVIDGSVLSRLIVASYNVLAEFEWPPQSDRHPGLIESLLSHRADADILVLEEVTDHFLPFLLSNENICLKYPFSTHGPSDQAGIGPLPSLLNVVVLSKFPIQWQYLSFQRKHKGCAIVSFPTIGIHDSDGIFRPWVLAACHLSQGLTDGAVVAKKNEIQRILDHHFNNHPQNPCIIAGDFNISTSAYTVATARKRQDISPQTVNYLGDIDHLLSEAGFQDTWLATRLESGESSDVTNDYRSAADVYEGEQGATFDPFVNSLAAKLVGTGLNNRPQRYDRILLKAKDQYHPQGFNMFGQAPLEVSGGEELRYPSDHWGIRCLLMRSSNQNEEKKLREVKVDIQKAPGNLEDLDDLKLTLDRHGFLPTDAERASRKDALQTLERVILGTEKSDSQVDSRSGLILRLVAVGSYGLGVWTSSSDIDCLCIGSISSKTFFSLAIQRLKKAGLEGIRILRRVRANSGYMLELEVCGIKFDLQYCAARSIAERWLEIMRRPVNDPEFALSPQVLSKLKPARDMLYLRRSIPDMGQYRVAHLFVKAWAKARGIYSSKFGFFGGIHISVLLVPLCKILARDGGTVSSSDLLITFFTHYASSDWEKIVVYDPFFHKDLRYHRTFREPLCLLGWHAPSLNTAMNASIPTVKAIDSEFKRARDLLMAEGSTWKDILELRNDNETFSPGNFGSIEFLQAYRSYVKLDAHYWGPSPEKGSRFIGWLESRCVMLLVDIDRKVKGISARIWPARFVDASSTATHDAGTEYHGCYLVGLEWDGGQESTKEEMKGAFSSLQNVLKEFEGRIHADEKYFDSRTCWMSSSVIRAHDLGNLELDQSLWGEGAGDDDDDDDSEDDMGLDDEEDEEGDGEADFGSGPRRGVTGALGRKGIVHAPGLGKFRMAADVLNRLRWDSNMDSSDYIVGYEDRFIGAQEKAVGQWKSDQTDEEFIPQHRILYFKRRSDGAIVWERRTRIDHIFGSGVKADNG